MDDVTRIITIIQIILFIFLIFLSTIYAIPIIFIRRFHNSNNIFTLNVSVAIICCALYWTGYYGITLVNEQRVFQPDLCNIMLYGQLMCTIQIPLALIIFSLHRLCSIRYHTRRFFKSKKWIITCISSQWIFGIVISIPNLAPTGAHCTISIWMRIYSFVFIVLLPSMICLILNLLIFIYARSSSRRIQPHIQNLQTNPNNIPLRQTMSRRDSHLLQHIILMFCVFVGGWAPLYISLILNIIMNINALVISVLIVLAELSVLFNVIQLFISNQPLRQFLKSKIL